MIPPVLFLLGYGVVRKITFSVLFCVLSTDLCIQIGNSVQNQNNQECLFSSISVQFLRHFPPNTLFLLTIDLLNFSSGWSELEFALESSITNIQIDP